MMLHIHNQTTESSLSTYEISQVQPNAIDLKVDKIFTIQNNLFTLSEEQKDHRGSELIEPDQNGFWYLNPGTYEVLMEGIISIGVNEAGFVITRSTLNRNGLFLTSGLYDSGYVGVMAGALHVTQGPAKIKRGTRIGQFLLWNAESVNLYNGSYGVNSQHDKKY